MRWRCVHKPRIPKHDVVDSKQCQWEYEKKTQKLQTSLQQPGTASTKHLSALHLIVQGCFSLLSLVCCWRTWACQKCSVKILMVKHKVRGPLIIFLKTYSCKTNKELLLFAFLKKIYLWNFCPAEVYSKQKLFWCPKGGSTLEIFRKISLFQSNLFQLLQGIV